MKLAGKAVLALALVGTGAAGGYYLGHRSSLPEAVPVVVIDGPSTASPGDTLKFTGERSASALPLEWWIDGRLRTKGNTLYVDSAPGGNLIVTAVAFGNGRNPPHAVASKLVTMGVTPNPGPTPPPGPTPGPTPPPPTPTPTPQSPITWAVVLYDPADARANPQVAAIQRDKDLRPFLAGKRITLRCLDATDDAVKAKFAGYFRAGIPALPSLLLLADSGEPPFVGPLPANAQAIQELVRKLAP